MDKNQQKQLMQLLDDGKVQGFGFYMLLWFIIQVPLVAALVDYMWVSFLVPLGVPPLVNLAHAYGFVFILYFLTSNLAKKTPPDTTQKRILTLCAQATIEVLFLFFFTWICQYLMNL